MSSLQDILVSHLESSPEILGRFSNIRCVNYTKSTKEKRGFFSLVFLCDDSKTGRPAVMKFFDPVHMNDAYRLTAFEREPIILDALREKKRCLQIIEGIKAYDLVLSHTGGSTAIPCKFFTMEYIENDVFDFFFRHDNSSVEERLVLFRDVVLATEAIHRWGVFHRDLKPDNFRAHASSANRFVVAVDMGTAARMETPALNNENDYSSPVGHLYYAAPETWCGLSGHRPLACYADYYALGCMLFELFNIDYFFEASRFAEKAKPAIAAITHILIAERNIDDKVRAWGEHAHRFRHSFKAPDIASPGSDVPLSIRSELNEILSRLVCFDYRERVSSLEWVRLRIDRTLGVMSHRKWEAWRTNMRERRRLARERRLLTLSSISRTTGGTHAR